MPDPMPEALFDALMARAGLTLTPMQRQSLLAASRHIVVLTESVHAPRPVAVEPATVFLP